MKKISKVLENKITRRLAFFTFFLTTVIGYIINPSFFIGNLCFIIMEFALTLFSISALFDNDLLKTKTEKMRLVKKQKIVMYCSSVCLMILLLYLYAQYVERIERNIIDGISTIVMLVLVIVLMLQGIYLVLRSVILPSR